MLQEYIQPEPIKSEDGSGVWVCEVCKEKVHAIKQVRVDENVAVQSPESPLQGCR